MRFTVLIEESESGYGAYVPDLPGCIAAAATRDEVRSLIEEAIRFHLENMRENGNAVPAPTTSAETVEIAAN